MRKVVLAAFAAMLLLALGTGAASANRSISLTPTTGQSAVSRALTFSSPEVEGFEVICEVTLTMEEIVRAASKTAGSRIGNIIDARVAGCRNGTATVLAPTRAAPWNTTYVSFTGTLPNITSVRLELRGAAFLVSAAGGLSRCLFRGNPQGDTVGGLRVTGFTATRGVNVGLSVDLRGFVACPRNGSFAGTFNLERTVTISLL